MLKEYPEYKETPAIWIDKIPSSWKSKKVRELYTERREKVSDKDYEPLSVCKAGIGPQLEDAVKTDNGDNRRLVKKGDFVINSRSDRKGSSGVSQYDGSVSLICITLKPITNENQFFMHYLLRSVPFTEEYYRNGHGLVADLWTTRYDEMQNIFLPIPPISEQNAIVKYLDYKTKQIDEFVSAKEKEITLLEEFKRSLISDYVSKGNSQTEMKESGIEWIHKIPKHWKTLMLFQCAEEYFKSNKDIHHQNLLSLSYGKIKRKDINTKGGLLPESFDNYQVVKKGNIILRLTDLQNDHRSLRTGLVTETGIITSVYVCIKPRENVTPEYLHWILHCCDLHKVFYGIGGGVRQSIGYTDISKMYFPIPPLEEQNVIADYLDKKTSEIDTLISSIQKQVTLVKELRTKLIADAVTGKIDVREAV